MEISKLWLNVSKAFERSVNIALANPPLPSVFFPIVSHNYQTMLSAVIYHKGCQ